MNACLTLWHLPHADIEYGQPESSNRTVVIFHTREISRGGGFSALFVVFPPDFCPFSAELITGAGKDSTLALEASTVANMI